MSIKKNFIYNLLLTGSNLLFPLITFPYLTRILGAEGLGTINFILSYCQAFTIVAALGLPMYGMREISRIGDDRNRRSQLFFELLFFHLFLTLLILVLYSVSIFVYHDFQNYRELMFLGVIMILFNIFSIEWLFGGMSDFKYITIRSVIIRLFSLLAIFLLVKDKTDINIYFIITVATLLLTAGTNINYARKYISLRIKLSFKKIIAHFKPVLLLGIYMVMTSIYSILPITLLGFLSTKAAVGYFYGANKIIYMTISVFTALTTVLFPKLNSYVENNENEAYFSVIEKALNAVISIGIPIVLLIYLLADPLIMLLAGKEFVSSISCIRVMAPLILCVGFAQVFVIMILNVNRRDREMVLLSVIGMVISLLINTLFIARFAEKASAIAQLVSESTVAVLSFLLARRFLNFQFPYKLLLTNLLFVLPFIPITFFSLRIADSVILDLLFAGLFCGIYFLFYQVFLLRDKFISGLLTPYSLIVKKHFNLLWKTTL